MLVLTSPQLGRGGNGPSAPDGTGHFDLPVRARTRHFLVWCGLAVLLAAVATTTTAAAVSTVAQPTQPQRQGRGSRECAEEQRTSGVTELSPNLCSAAPIVCPSRSAGASAASAENASRVTTPTPMMPTNATAASNPARPGTVAARPNPTRPRQPAGHADAVIHPARVAPCPRLDERGHRGRYRHDRTSNQRPCAGVTQLLECGPQIICSLGENSHGRRPYPHSRRASSRQQRPRVLDPGARPGFPAPAARSLRDVRARRAVTRARAGTAPPRRRTATGDAVAPVADLQKDLLDDPALRLALEQVVGPKLRGHVPTDRWRVC
ncbi:MAG: hypothetical protein JWR58_5411 [Pseudonocardia sp.]|nr:hypothetical protein [Pseudonocardia sp.]